MRVGDLLRRAIAQLEAAGVTQASVDTALLLGHCLALSRTQLFLAAEDEVDPACEKRFFELLARRMRREPVAYILGEREFWSLPFSVSEDVLIPRPETEFLLETVLQTVRRDGRRKGGILDLCSGSGVIAVVLARELRSRVVAVDLSAATFPVARKNAERHGVAGLIDFVRGDLLTPFGCRRPFSLIVSNPPYVTTGEIRTELEPEVACYEPHAALHGGDDGLDVVRRIRRDLPRVLTEGGWFFMEIGAGQGAAVHELFAAGGDRDGGFEPVRVLPDYAGRDRVLAACWKRRRGEKWKN